MVAPEPELAVVTSAAGSSLKVDLTALLGSVVQKGDKTELKGTSLGNFTLGRGGFQGDGLSVRRGKKLGMFAASAPTASAMASSETLLIR